MATDGIVQVRIDRRIKKEAAHVLEGMGLSVSDAVRMLLMRIAREKAIPFDIRVPNAQTVAAIDELESGKGVSSNSVEELMADLNAPD
jgi:DNA-damage-inducible protein J